jgi:hypothetical protein
LANNNSYDFRVTAKNIIGEGTASDTINGTPGSPAQVFIQGFGDTIATDISANVRITNDSDTFYEYQYRWCVTNSESNLCGGGDDISTTATAAIGIDPHTNFDTALPSTVSGAGTYYFHLEVLFGSRSSEAIQSFIATAGEVVTPPGGGGDRGGGGGGGGSTEPKVVPTGAGGGSDFNGDGKVNSVDFSIMLAFWKTRAPFKNSWVDINRDGQVNSIDFSILLFQWGKKPTLFKR